MVEMPAVDELSGRIGLCEIACFSSQHVRKRIALTPFLWLESIIPVNSSLAWNSHKKGTFGAFLFSVSYTTSDELNHHLTRDKISLKHSCGMACQTWPSTPYVVTLACNQQVKIRRLTLAYLPYLMRSKLKHNVILRYSVLVR